MEPIFCSLIDTLGGIWPELDAASRGMISVVAIRDNGAAWGDLYDCVDRGTAEG